MTAPRNGAEKRAWTKLFISPQRLESFESPDQARALMEAVVGCRALLDPTLGPREMLGAALAHLVRATGAERGAVIVDELAVSLSTDGGTATRTGVERHAVEYVHHTGFAVQVPPDAGRGLIACVPLIRPDSPLVRGVFLLAAKEGATSTTRLGLEMAFVLGRQLALALQLRGEKAARQNAERVEACAKQAVRSARSAAASAERASAMARRAEVAGAPRVTHSVSGADTRPASRTPAKASPRPVLTVKPAHPSAVRRGSSPTLTLWVAVHDEGRAGETPAARPITLDGVFEGSPSLGFLEED